MYSVPCHDQIWFLVTPLLAYSFYYLFQAKKMRLHEPHFSNLCFASRKGTYFLYILDTVHSDSSIIIAHPKQLSSWYYNFLCNLSSIKKPSLVIHPFIVLAHPRHISSWYIICSCFLPEKTFHVVLNCLKHPVFGISDSSWIHLATLAFLSRESFSVSSWHGEYYTLIRL